MKHLISFSEPTNSPPKSGCEGKCSGCGKIHIKLLSYADESGRQLRNNVDQALEQYSVPNKIIEVHEPGAVAATGVTHLPALLMEGEIMVQGRVPTPEEIVAFLHEQPYRHIKLQRLSRIAVAVDVSKCSDSALRFGWHIANQTGAQLEVVYTMDSIFNEHRSSESGFLAGYQHTMQQELDQFIQKTMHEMGVPYHTPLPGGPGRAPDVATVSISSKVLYGFPELMLEEFSKNIDLLIVGMTGKGKPTGKLFGSVSVEVSQRAHCPVLLVPADATFDGLKNVLYASHFDSLSALHIRQALAFGQHFDAQMHFVHVSQPDEKEKMNGSLLESVYRESHAARPFLFRKMLSENVLQALYEYAFYHRIELLVFVTPERSFWGNLLHRSITRAAAYTADLPILVIHADDEL